MIAKHAGRYRKTAHSYQQINTIVECTSNYCDDFGIISTRKRLEVDIICFIHRINSTD